MRIKVECRNDQTEITEPNDIDNTKFKSPAIAAKHLVSKHELDMYFEPRPNVSFSNHAVAVVAATAAIVAAVSSVIEASKRGRTVDTIRPVDLRDSQVSDLDIERLLEIRGNSY